MSKSFGIKLTSFYKIGGIGTAFAGLAAQKSAQAFVSGIQLVLGDTFKSGDHIRLGKGLEGEVVLIGLGSTTIKTADGYEHLVLNSDIAAQDIVNLSRQKKSHIKETGRLRFEDLSAFDDLKARITDEIEKSCPHVITTGTDKMQIYCTEWKPRWVQVTMEFYLDMSPVGEEYKSAKQCVLSVAARAANVDNSGYFNPEPP